LAAPRRNLEGSAPTVGPCSAWRDERSAWQALFWGILILEKGSDGIGYWIGPHRRRIARVGFALLLAFVVYASLAPATAVPPAGAADKVAHLVAYAILQLVAATAFCGRRSLLHAALALIAVGGGLELIQTQIPSRSAEWLDFAANTVGVLMASAIWITLNSFRRWLAA
jgi:VanZ family protein